jgi:hypothetical protein
MRFAAGLQEFVALVLLPVGAVWGAGEDVPVAATARGQETPDDEWVPGVQDFQPFAPASDAAGDTAAESHRRHAPKNKQSKQTPPATLLPAEPIATTETPLERLQRLCAGDAELPKPIIISSTLAEVMRRVALWGDPCPFCGHAHAGKMAPTGERPAAEPKVSAEMLEKLLAVDPATHALDGLPRAQPLRDGEPAQVILDTQKRLGKSVLEGTEFSGSPDLLVQWIRVLDDEHRLRQAALDDNARAQLTAVADDDRVTPRSQIEALRAACRDLCETADLLEEQNLFDAADSLRGIADALRRQSRQKLAEREPTGDEPRATEGHVELPHAELPYPDAKR